MKTRRWWLAIAVAVLVTGCSTQPTYMPVDYHGLMQNCGRYYAEGQRIEVRGQVVELVESADYTELGDPAGRNADVVFTVESFLLNVGDPLPEPMLKKLHKAFEQDGTLGEDAGTVLEGEDLDLVLVRWTAPPDIPQREDPLADPYPVTPGTQVVVQGVLTSDSVEPWRHCRGYGSPYGDQMPCTNIPGVSGLRIEATRVAEIEAARFGSADGPLGE